jgi:starch-binding outer membrane protein, SusD/RagB family
MKTQKYLLKGLFILMIMALITSCSDNLDIDATSELESVYFETEERVQRGIGAAYASLANIYGPQLNETTQHPFWLLPGDDLTFDGSGNSLETFSGLNGSNARVEGMWKRLYATVARCNFMIDKLNDETVAGVFTTDGLKDANRGEMLFIRSWSFFKLWDWYRKAPIQDSRITSIENALLPPSSGFEMLDNAIASLEEAAKLLPETWDARNLGRITKNSANGLLVKCYVLRACYNGKSTEDYAKAITAFKRITGSAQLVKYGENFDYRHENNAESLFEYQASHAPTQDNAWLSNDFGGGVGQMGAFYHYSNGHWGNYGSGTIGPTLKLINAFEPGDPRKEETISNNADNLNWSLWWITPQWNKFNGYQIVKYTNGERGNIYDKTWQLSSSNNPRLLRLSDVKLDVAEAYLATGDAANALIQVNDIRTRARQSTADGVESAVPANLVSVTMTDIINERFLELAGEDGQRWTDLRKWHSAGYINLNTWTASDFGFPYDSGLFVFDSNTHLLFPIPISELDRNANMASSGQNPGY